MLGDQDLFSLIFDEFAFTHPRNLVEEVLECTFVRLDTRLSFSRFLEATYA